MARQKQVDEALQRAFDGRAPMGKVRAAVVKDGGQRLLQLYHYHHELLAWRLPTASSAGVSIRAWHEKPTDKRILDAALAFLQSSDNPWPCTGTNGITQAPTAIDTTRKRKSDCAAASTPPLGTVQSSVHALGRHGTINLALGAPIEEKGSVFRAAVAYPIASREAADAAVAQLRANPAFSGATHRVSACRCSDGAEHCDDDGEERAGASLRTALRQDKIVGAVAVVARWYGGVNIGKARFRLIQERALTAFKAVGHVPGIALSDAKFQKCGVGHTLGGTCVERSDSMSANERRAQAAAAAERRLQRRLCPALSQLGSVEVVRESSASVASVSQDIGGPASCVLAVPAPLTAVVDTAANSDVGGEVPLLLRWASLRRADIVIDLDD